MNIIVCLDDRGGMLFGGRRQSQDKMLRAQALLLAGEGKLWMNGYSAKQFGDHAERIMTDEDFLTNAPADAWCFVEDSDIMPWLPETEKIAVYRWNRHYPSDVKFPVAGFEEKWERISTREFAGSSHDVITEEVYRL